MLEGVWVIVGNDKIFANKMAAFFLPFPIQHLSMLHTDCSHVIIGIKPYHHKCVLSISPRELVWGDGITLAATDQFPGMTSLWCQGLIP